MAMANLIDRIVGKQRARQVSDFRDIVTEIADGREPDEDIIAQVLFESGKSLDELREDVELLKRRRELRTKWNAVPGLMAERKKLQQQIDEANRELKAAERKHFAIANPIIAELDQLKEATYDGEKAKFELWNTCNDPTLLDKMADIQLRLAKKRQEASDLQTRIDNLHEWAKYERAEAARQKMMVDADHLVDMSLNRAKEHERKAAEHEVTLKKVTKVIAGLERDEEAVREQMLEP